MKTPCDGIWGRLFGHKYVARYDTEDNFPSQLDLGKSGPQGPSIVGQYAWYCLSTMSGYQIDQSKNKKRTYVHDVCVRCGHVINRSQDGS